MSNVLLFSDSHLSDKSPSACADSYLDDLFDLLYQVTEIARQRKVQFVVCAGDMFHNKTPRNNSHSLVQRAIMWAQSLPCTFYVTPGNHDMLADRSDSILETQPLGTLFRSGAAGLLKGWASSFLYGVPWLQSFDDVSVSNALLDFRENSEPNSILVTHAPLYPPGKELTFENYPAAKWAAAMGNKGNCFYGHVHEPHGVYEVDGVKFANFGALSRGSLHEYNLTRDVCVGLWDSDTGEFERVVLDYKPASEVFKLEEKKIELLRRDQFDEFFSKVTSSTVKITSVESVLEHIRSMNLGEDLNNLAAELLEGVQNGNH